MSLFDRFRAMLAIRPRRPQLTRDSDVEPVEGERGVECRATAAVSAVSPQ